MALFGNTFSDGEWHHFDSKLDDHVNESIWFAAAGFHANMPTTGTYDLQIANAVLLHADGTMQSIYTGGSASVDTFQPGFYGGSVNNSSGTEATQVDDGAGTFYTAGDHLGTAQMELASNGQPVWKGEFAPFGQELSEKSSAATRYKFTGKERDEESGLDYFGARYYASNQGRWISPDALFADQHLNSPQSWNLYQYSFNDPLSKLDPNGRQVYVASQLALKLIRQTLPASARSSVRLDSNGHINAKALNALHSNDSNVMALKDVVNNAKLVNVYTDQAYTRKNGTSEQFSYRSDADIGAEYKKWGLPSKEGDNAMFHSGQTQGPSESQSGQEEVHVSDATGKAAGMPVIVQVQTMAEELYVHAKHEMKGEPAKHGNPSRPTDIDREELKVTQTTDANQKSQ